jgi:hypothetical protein
MTNPTRYDGLADWYDQEIGGLAVTTTALEVLGRLGLPVASSAKPTISHAVGRRGPSRRPLARILVQRFDTWFGLGGQASS